MGLFFSRKKTEEREKPKITEQDKAVLVGINFTATLLPIDRNQYLKYRTTYGHLSFLICALGSLPTPSALPTPPSITWAITGCKEG